MSSASFENTVIIEILIHVTLLLSRRWTVCCCVQFVADDCGKKSLLQGVVEKIVRGGVELPRVVFQRRYARTEELP